jgi:phosphoribosylamine--glycine ligase
MGDPETQPIMLRLKSDLFEVFELACAGALDQAEIDWDRRTALGVVLAAAGYPDAPRQGDAIEGLDRVASAAHPNVHVFHAGTAQEGDRVVVSGGRVLCVTALGDSVRLAQRAAYAAVADIRFAGMQFRTDIGHRALAARTP